MVILLVIVAVMVVTVVKVSMVVRQYRASVVRNNMLDVQLESAGSINLKCDCKWVVLVVTVVMRGQTTGPAPGAGGDAGDGGSATAEIKDVTVTGSAGVDTITLSVMATGGAGGLGGAGGANGSNGSAGSGTVSLIGNTVNAGDGDDTINVFMQASP